MDIGFVHMESRGCIHRQFLRLRRRHACSKRSSIVAKRNEISEEACAFACDECCVDHNRRLMRRAHMNLARANAEEERACCVRARAKRHESFEIRRRKERAQTLAQRRDFDRVHAEIINKLRDFEILRTRGDAYGIAVRARLAIDEHEYIINDRKRISGIVRDNDRSSVG